MTRIKWSRRGFVRRMAQFSLAGLAGSAIPLGSKARAEKVAPSDRVRLGVIGCGGMGGRHLEALAVDPQCEVVVICDVFKQRYENWQKKVGELSGKAPEAFQDFRYLLDRKDLDAVFVVTPDHWHPLLTILLCQAGKDVYVEKPVCTTIEEGRAMVNAARRYGRIVQAGTQQRSTPIFIDAMKLIHSGKLGKITSATAWVDANGWSDGEKIEDPPEGLDWDLWLGPAPKVPYSKQRHFGFMGWHDYARGGQLTNWGIHLVDVLHWGIGEDRPLSIQALGGSFRGGAGSDNYECIEALFEFKGCNVTWEQRHQNFYEKKDYGMKFQGTDGALFIDRNTFIVRPDTLGIPEYVGEPEKSWANPDHHHNFFDSVRSRKTPAADIEQGFRSTATVLLAGIALKAGRKLVWDGDAERFVGDEQANRYLTRTYRAPWHL